MKLQKKFFNEIAHHVLLQFSGPYSLFCRTAFDGVFML